MDEKKLKNQLFPAGQFSEAEDMVLSHTLFFIGVSLISHGFG